MLSIGGHVFRRSILTNNSQNGWHMPCIAPDDAYRASDALRIGRQQPVTNWTLPFDYWASPLGLLRRSCRAERRDSVEFRKGVEELESLGQCFA